MEENKNLQEDKIDLYYILFTLCREFVKSIKLLIKGTGWIFCKIAYGLCYLYCLIKKKIWLLLLATALSVGLAYFTIEYLPEFYKAECLAETQLIPIEQHCDLINSLNEYILKENYQGLSEQMNIHLSEAEKVVSIKATIVNKNISVIKNTNGIMSDWMRADSIVDMDIKVLKIIFKSINNNFENLEKGIVFFIDNNSNVKTRYNTYLKSIEHQKEIYTAQIQKLELFQNKNLNKTADNLILGKTPMTIISEEKTYIEEILDLQNNLVLLQERFTQVKPITIIKPVVVPATPVYHSLAWYSVAWAALMWTIVLFVSTCIDCKKNKKHIKID